MTPRGLRLRCVVDGWLRLQLDADMKGFVAGQEALREFLRDAGANATGAYHAELAFEELVSNVIRHGYPGGGGSIEVGATVRPGEIELTLEDEGLAFNPLDEPEPAKPASLEAARIGGLGITLVRMAASGIEYERAGNRNRLRVRILND